MASWYLVAIREHSSNNVWPSRSASSSRILRLVGSARALNTSPTEQIIGKRTLACQARDAGVGAEGFAGARLDGGIGGARSVARGGQPRSIRGTARSRPRSDAAR